MRKPRAFRTAVSRISFITASICGAAGWTGAVPIVRIAAPSVIQVDAAHGFCHAAFVSAEEQFVALTRRAGLACLGITRSHSASALGWFVDRLSRHGLVCIGCSNSSPLVAPWAASAASSARIRWRLGLRAPGSRRW
jgi:LDH2 family malate/lactate/ureidoglycolate dehydrogenase